MSCWWKNWLRRLKKSSTDAVNARVLAKINPKIVSIQIKTVFLMWYSIYWSFNMLKVQNFHRFPRFCCSCSIAVKSAWKFPAPNPWWFLRWIISMNRVGLSFQNVQKLRSYVGWIPGVLGFSMTHIRGYRKTRTWTTVTIHQKYFWTRPELEG